MAYVDGFVAAVPNANKEAFIEHAKYAAQIFKDHGALKVVEDSPNARVVVIFPDNVFKYASSVQRYFAELFQNTAGSSAAGPTKSNSEIMLDAMISLARNDETTIELDDAYQLHQSCDALFVDVRNRQQYGAMHVAGAVSVPMEDVLNGDEQLPSDFQHPIITVCNLGNLSVSGMLALKSRGYQNVRSLNGGTRGWEKKGYPVEV